MNGTASICRRWSFALAAVFAVSLGCDDTIQIQNVAPSVTAVGPVTLQKDDTVRLFVWIRDHEEDPVDITVLSIDTKGSETELNITGGHLTTGLTSSQEPTGQVHELIWEPKELPTDPIQLRIRPIDWNGAEGKAFTTESFVLTDGLPAP